MLYRQEINFHTYCLEEEMINTLGDLPMNNLLWFLEMLVTTVSSLIKKHSLLASMFYLTTSITTNPTIVDKKLPGVVLAMTTSSVATVR